MKKILALVLVLVMGLTLLVGCGEDKEGSGDPGENPAGQEDVIGGEDSEDAPVGQDEVPGEDQQPELE